MKLFTSQVLAWLVPVLLIALLGSDAYARTHHLEHPLNSSSFHDLEISSSIHDPEISPVPASAHHYTGGPKSND